MTSHQERVIRPGWESKTPRSPDEFAQAWKASQHRALLMIEIEDYLSRHPFDGESYEKFATSRKIDQSSAQRLKSPYTLSFLGQVDLTLWRSWVMLINDPSITVTMLITNMFEALMISSIFYNMQMTTESLFNRGILIFFIVMMNAFSSILEVLTLFSKRKIVEKHARYALYHPSAEALSSMVVDLPYKIAYCIFMNSTLYFMSNLRREPGAFFFFLLISFSMVMSMSMMFRFIGSVAKSEAQALAPASVLLLAIALYAGFAIPPEYMEDWFGWFRWINPVYYALESLLVNEFVGRDYRCSQLIPSGPDYMGVDAAQQICSVVGSVAGQDSVDGQAHILLSYGFKASHKWRNLGIIIAILLFCMGVHLFAAEFVATAKSKGEVLVFKRGAMKQKKASDIESGESRAGDNGSDTEAVADMEKQTSVFHWKDVCYTIKVKGEERRILDHVDGWVKPGTLTALMVSGQTPLILHILLFRKISTLWVLMLTLSGCVWCRQNHTSRCPRQPCDHGRYHRLYAGRWLPSQLLLPTQNGIRATARSSPAHFHRP